MTAQPRNFVDKVYSDNNNNNNNDDHDTDDDYDEDDERQTLHPNTEWLEVSNNYTTMLVLYKFFFHLHLNRNVIITTIGMGWLLTEVEHKMSYLRQLRNI